MAERKRTSPLDWEDVRFFVALAEHGSLSATARALHVNHATVSRRVAALEGRLGRSLFDRRAQGYALTLDGRAVLDEARAMAEAAAGLIQRLETEAGASGVVRLTTVRALADHFLIDRLDGFHRRHPDLDLEILIDARVMSLARREADIALRLGRPRDSDLLARRVGRIAFAFYAAPAIRKALVRGQSPYMIGYDDDSDFVAEAKWLDQHFRDRRFAFRSNGQTSQAAAARAGFGVALLPRYLGRADPGLVEVDFGALPPEREIWILVRRDLARVPRVRIVADELAGLFHANQSLLGG